MKEKTLYQTTAVSPFKILFLTLAGLALLAMFIVATAYDGNPFKAFKYFGEGYYAFVIGAFVFVILAFLLNRKHTLTITDVRVRVDSDFGTVTELPVNAITATGCGLFKSLSVATSGGRIVLFNVQDRLDAYRTLSGLLLINRNGIRSDESAKDVKREKESEKPVETPKKPETPKPTAVFAEPIPSAPSSEHSPSSAPTINVDGLTFVEKGSEVEATGQESGKSRSKLILPQTVNGKAVTTIGANAFAASGLIEAVIPDGVTLIKPSAFRYTKSLKTITLPASLKEVSGLAFCGCDSLSTVRYRGSKEQWAGIQINSWNYPLQNANVIFNCNDN